MEIIMFVKGLFTLFPSLTLFLVIILFLTGGYNMTQHVIRNTLESNIMFGVGVAIAGVGLLIICIR